MLDQILEILPPVLLLGGAAFSVAAGIGLLRFADVLTRLHAVTKPQVFGLLLVLLAVAIDQRSWLTLLALSPVFIFQVLTAPVAAHMVARAAYRTGDVSRERVYKDELAERLEADEGAIDDSPATGRAT